MQQQKKTKYPEACHKCDFNISLRNLKEMQTIFVFKKGKEEHNFLRVEIFEEES